MNPEFYEDEVIEGFYVPSMLKKAWGVQMDVLNETDAICRRHDIPYFADWGTLLAAIRHNGYIPWDDDLDISMRRRDYERFLLYAKEELPEGFKVMTYKSQPDHHFFVARIVGKPRICFEEDHLRRFHGFPYIAGIDLFVLDNVYKDRDKERIRAKKAEYVVTVADNIADGRTTGKEARDQIAQCEEYTGKRIDRNLSGEDLRIRMYELAEGLFSMALDAESDALCQMMPFGLYDNHLYIPKEYYRSTVRLPYMETQISVPVCFDAVMRMKFGNYMEIRKSWNGHDYPFFYGQHESLVKCLDFEYPAYNATADDIISLRQPVLTERKEDDIKDIVFIPFSSKYWKYMEKLYKKYADTDDWRVWVVPIPYYYKGWDGALSDMVFETDTYPSDLYLQDYTEVDLESFHPDAIVIQNPFDEWNSTVSVPPSYYSSKLKGYTDKLIYIPFFVTDDFVKEQEREYTNMDHYVCMPGVINADRVILPSDILKNTYIDKITEFVRTDDESLRKKLEEKIAVCPELVYPDDEVRAVPSVKGDSRKTVLFYTSISTLAEKKENAIDKINRVINLLAENSDRINVIWISQLYADIASVAGENVEMGYRGSVKNFEKMQIGDYIENADSREFRTYLSNSDAYYGEPSALALSFAYAQKPVMLINTDV